MQLVLTPELMIEAYKQGLFPMAYHASSPYIHWICPDMRGQFSITEMHIPKSLKKQVKKFPYEIRINTDFEAVINECAQETDDRPETWINQPILDAFIKLHQLGHAHSVECWLNGKLVGGLYGLAIGGVFCGESMFSRADNASKIALVHLVARLWKGGFEILDTQFVNPHLEQFGVYEIPHDEYKKQLDQVKSKKTSFLLEGLENEVISEKKLIEEYFEMRAQKNI